MIKLNLWKEPGKINARQLIGMLVLSRMFILLNYVPYTHLTVSGSTGLLVIVLGWGFTFLALIPAYLLLNKSQNSDIIAATSRLAPKLHKPMAFLFYLICVIISGETMAQFELFLSTVIYPSASRTGMIIICAIGVLYMTHLGLEAVARVSVIVAALTIGVYVLVFIGFAPLVDMVNIISPFYDGIKPLIFGTFKYFAQNIEMIAFFMLIPDLINSKASTAEKKPLKSFIWFATFSALILEAINFAATTVLGNYGQTLSFPIYTLSSVSGSEAFYRFDFFHIVIWVCIAMIRAALYLILATKSLNIIFDGKLTQWGLLINGALATSIALICSKNINIFIKIYQIIASGIPVVILLVVLPTFLICVKFFAQKKINNNK